MAKKKKKKKKNWIHCTMNGLLSLSIHVDWVDISEAEVGVSEGSMHRKYRG